MSKHEIFGMSNLAQQHTGLPLAVMVRAAPQNKKDPSVKIAHSTDGLVDKGPNFSLSISLEPKKLMDPPVGIKFKASDVRKVANWVVSNRSLLLKYWYGITTDSITVQNLLISNKDYGVPFDTTLDLLRTAWNLSLTPQARAALAKINIQAVELIVKRNRALFPVRK